MRDAKVLDLSQLDNILRTTIETILQGQRQMFGIAENARDECELLQEELHSIQMETLDIIEQVDECETLEQEARKDLARVSTDFRHYSEEDIKQAYEKAKNVQIKLALLRDREKRLREKRTERELQFRNLKTTVKKAEGLISHVGVAIEYLNSNLEHIWLEVEKAQDMSSVVLAVIKAQEEERKRVARDIHDGPAQSVANLVLQVEYCQKLLEVDPSKVKEELEQLKSVARSNLENIRKIIFALRPMDLDDLGLVPAVKRYLSEFEKASQLEVSFKFMGSERRYSSALEVAVFRIIQESLNNVVKHAKASRVEVILETQPGSIGAIVRDDGTGFLVEGGVSENSFGLRGMKERTSLLKGELHISSAPGEGTEVFVKIPVTEEGEEQ